MGTNQYNITSAPKSAEDGGRISVEEANEIAAKSHKELEEYIAEQKEKIALDEARLREAQARLWEF